jgi:hypothetical protein
MVETHLKRFASLCATQEARMDLGTKLTGIHASNVRLCEKVSEIIMDLMHMISDFQLNRRGFPKKEGNSKELVALKTTSFRNQFRGECPPESYRARRNSQLLF